MKTSSVPSIGESGNRYSRNLPPKVTEQESLSGASISAAALSSVPPEPTVLAAHDSRLAQVVQELPDGIILMDRDWRIVYANTAGRRISRILPEHMNGPTHWEIYPETVGTELERIYRQVADTGQDGHVPAFYYEPFDVWFDVRATKAGDGIALFYRDITAFYRAKAARDALSQQLEQVFDATTDGVTMLDRDWNISFVNGKGRELLAASGDILGANIWERFPDAARPDSPYWHNYHLAMDEGIPNEFEAHYAAPLNVWLHLIVRPSRDGIIVFFRDVTEQRRQQEALRNSEQRYRVLTELNPQALWTADPEGRVLYANQTFIEYLGKDFELTNGDEYITRFDPEDRERVVETWTRCIRTGEEYSIDARLIRYADKASRWWHIGALPLRDREGKIEQWLGVAGDINESRMAAQQLRQQYVEIEQNRRQLAAIFNGSPIGMALYDADSLRLLQLNNRQAEIIGLPPTKLLGMTVMEVAPTVPLVHDLMRRAARGEPVLNHPVESATLASSPGEHRTFSVNYTPIFAEDGTVQAVAGATVETTHQKRAEAALIQSEKLAAVGRLASSIAHEINNPLEAVMNLLFLARNSATLPEVQQLLDSADEELRRVAIITSQTLRFHKQTTRANAISCTDLYATVLSIYQGRLRNAGIQVERRKRAKATVTCFEGEIRQVLNNLVGNAIDAMPRGGRLLVRSREATDWKTGEPGLVLTVADTGSGISKATMARIFDAFFTTKGINGTGLGLWISSEIVKRHGGTMRIRSSQKEGQHGTVATLFLPFTPAVVATSFEAQLAGQSFDQQPASQAL